MRQPYQIREARPSRSNPVSRCVHCGEHAAKEALFRRDGVVIVEKYCEGCLQAEKFTAIMSFYAKQEERG